MTALPTISTSGKESLDKLLKETVARKHVPGIFYGVTNPKEEIYFNQQGDKIFGDESSGQITSDTTTECFSQTKLITCIAALQLVDQKLVSLDSTDDIKKFLPEIDELEVLKGYDENDKPILEKPTNKVTLRMLMSHSAGFTYMFAPNVLSKWHEQNPSPGLFDPKATVKSLITPFIYHPGKSWQYSTSIDWVGKLVERVSKLDLEEYFKKNLFEPCGIKTLTFYPTELIKKEKMSICYRDQQGNPQIIPNGFGMGRPTDENQVPKELLSGGGGLYGTQKDYLTFLRHLLRCNPFNKQYLGQNEKPLISPESWKELFTPSIPKGEGYDGVDNILAMVSKPQYIHPEPTVNNINHSVGFLLTLEDFTGGRKAGSGCWSGAAKTQFWIDPTTNIAAICGTQLLSPSPDPWYASYVEYERAVYAGLSKPE
ncbi:uncharacterized protein L201_007557 [Kwoniella dendrophila CBS 6074]|uniref:Beta-lactamase-related domain-containing protein n=1 Tax=Kwoniella dendrophila CBS 6074 TaxID=1295534 RepID=A0AAX4K678_9TREE